MNEALKNPYFNIYHWVKGEIFDILAVFNACDCKDKTQDKVNKNVKKKKNTQEDIDNITTGKKTLSTLLKNQSDTGNMMNKIESTDQEIENLNNIYDVITIYLGEKIIPDFKKKRIGLYQKIV